MKRLLGYFVRLNPVGEHQLAIVRELRRLGVPFTLIGGVAMSAYREARATEDVDVVAAPDPKQGTLAQLAAHLARLVPGSRVVPQSHERGKKYYRIVVGHGKKTRAVADVAPTYLYSQYASALASARPRTLPGYEGLGVVPVTGLEEMIALKIRSYLSPYRRYDKRSYDEGDIFAMLDRANLAKVRALVADVPGGVEALQNLVTILAARRGRRLNPRSVARCRACNRAVPIVRGGRFKAHNFRYFRCAGSGAPA